MDEKSSESCMERRNKTRHNADGQRILGIMAADFTPQARHRMYDRADKLLEQWNREKPELEHLDTAALIGRFALIGAHLDKHIQAHHKTAGLAKGEFDVLASLRRAGSPFVLSPTELYKTVMLTSGAMTNRLDRLENKGLIARIRHESDRRSMLVQLTPEGVALIDTLLQSHLDCEHELIHALNEEERQQLDALLKKWLAQFEAPRNGP